MGVVAQRGLKKPNSPKGATRVHISADHKLAIRVGYPANGGFDLYPFAIHQLTDLTDPAELATAEIMADLAGFVDLDRAGE